MKKGLSLFLSFIMVLGVFISVPVTVSAASVDDLTFELNDEGTMYQVIGCNSNASGDIVIPENYNGLPVTKIGSRAFYECRKLTSVEIPDTVTIVGEFAFYECSNLTSVTIGNNVTSIGNSAFYGCTSLTSITIPDSVTSIGAGSFWKCTNLTSVTIGDNVTSIGNSAFRDCTGLTSIITPDSVASIGQFAFSDCTSLASITLSKSITSIDWQTFYGCTSLISISIPDGVKSISAYAFYDCKSLTTVSIPDSVTWIGGSAFYGCSILTSITIPDSVKSIDSSAFGYKYSSWEEKTVKIEDFTIYGYKGSAAEKYANDNGFDFVKLECEKHIASSWIIDTKATVNTAGSKHKECTKCGEILETAEIPQLKCSKPKLKTISNTEYGVKITWGKVSGADKYYVYRKTSSGSYSRIGSTTKTYYTDKTAKSGKKYYYIVKAINEAGSSSSSSSKSIYHLADTTLSTPKSTKSGITLKWKKVTGADGYMVYRKTGTGSYTKIATVKGSSKVTYTDKSAKKGKKYTYKVKAYKSKTYSAYSNTKTIKDKY